MPRNELPAPAAAEPAGGAPDAAEPDTVPAIEAAIRRYLSGYRTDGRGSLGRLAPSRSLWREVSSLTLLELVSFLEQHFGITVRPIDFAPQNFESISAIAQFVAAHQPRLPGP
jgi:hypothetical protein